MDARAGTPRLYDRAVHRGAQSVYDRNGTKLFEGEWDPRTLVEILSGDDSSFWRGKRVLDIGANTGGLSVELACRGAAVTLAEPDPYGNNLGLTRDLLARIQADEQLQLEITNADLFSCHELERHDVVLCLGLLYHFRDPQFAFDYLSSLEPRFLFVSCQTHPSDELAMFNRAQPGILPRGHLSDDIVLTGWHPTRPLLERMLAWAGFQNIVSLTAERFDFPRKPEGATNSAYYRAELDRSVDPDDARRIFYPR